MRVDLFDFELPPERIALRPVRPRDAARLLVVKGEEPLADRSVRDLPQLLRRGDVLVFNDTRVIPAQLEGRRGEARIGATLHKRIDLRRWQAFVRNAKRLRGGDVVEFRGGVTAMAEARHEDGSWTLAFAGEEPVEILLERAGTMPLPPYIAGKRPTDEADRNDYQTMFAREEGAVAAPTAALHFTPELMAALSEAGIGHETLTLHVGAGTFLPVKAEDTEAHRMHAEWGRIDAATADRLNAVRASGGRIVAVGTTSLRLLESAAGGEGVIRPFAGDTAIFITPGYRFRAIDGLMTNFHLPRSTLFMLVSALMGLERMQAAYAHAIAEGYRFYSYGDASLLLPDGQTNGQLVAPMADAILDIQGLCKTYPARKGGGAATVALDSVDLQIRQGEIFALLGPNGAGKTTLIGAVCGLVRPSGGTIRAFGLDMKRDWRRARARIGLVPQELSVDMFEHVLMSVNHSRGLFGLAPDAAKIEEILRALSLWDKRNSRISELSGGMKRRVLIAKALAHEPELLFFDEPTAGVDVELRRDMWRLIGELREKGVTIILTTHYIEEAEEMADRVGVINAGKLILVDEKQALMARLGTSEARIGLVAPLREVPAALASFGVQLVQEGGALVYRTKGDDGQDHAIADLVKALVSAGIEFKTFDVHQSSLEDIFVDLVERKAP